MVRVDHPADRLEVIVVDDAGGEPGTAQVVAAPPSEPVGLRLITQQDAGAAATH